MAAAAMFNASRLLPTDRYVLRAASSLVFATL